MIAQFAGVVLLDVQAAELIAAELERYARGVIPSDAVRSTLTGLAFELRTPEITGDTPPNARKSTGCAAAQSDSCHDADHAPTVSPADAARILGRTPNAMRDLARRGSIPARRLGGRWAIDAAAVAERAAAMRLDRYKQASWE